MQRIFDKNYAKDREENQLFATSLAVFFAQSALSAIFYSGLAGEQMHFWRILIFNFLFIYTYELLKKLNVSVTAFFT